MDAAIQTIRSNRNQLHPMDEMCINTIRTLSMDAVQAANSGHPGTPLALAPAPYCLWRGWRTISIVRTSSCSSTMCMPCAATAV